MDRNLALEAVRATEGAALAASRQMGRGDERAADQAAIAAMHAALCGLDIAGTVVIGEGEQDQAPLLYIGERLGAGRDGPLMDIAVDPLEGNTTCAKGGDNAMAVVAMAEHGGFLDTPDVYMDKIAVGPHLPSGVVDLDETPVNNLRNLAKAKKVEIADLLICILDRPRHEELIAKVREAGARIIQITDGDLSGVIATAHPQAGIDMYMGRGGAYQGVLAGAALYCVGGQMQGRLVLRSDSERNAARRRGMTDFDRKYQLTDLVHGEVMFAVTGVTDGPMLRGVRRYKGGATTHSMVVRSKSGTVRYIEAHHNSASRAGLDWLAG
jgi:fructose-1,6-bisphosphatase II / sedoheptulose-1,7-bisphosphatase